MRLTEVLLPYLFFIVNTRHKAIKRPCCFCSVTPTWTYLLQYDHGSASGWYQDIRNHQLWTLQGRQVEDPSEWLNRLKCKEQKHWIWIIRLQLHHCQITRLPSHLMQRFDDSHLMKFYNFLDNGLKFITKWQNWPHLQFYKNLFYTGGLWGKCLLGRRGIFVAIPGVAIKWKISKRNKAVQFSSIRYGTLGNGKILTGQCFHWQS